MEEITKTRVEEKLPKLGFGMMRLPVQEDGKTVIMERVIEMVDAYMASGMNYFDTAYMYHGGESERIFREAVAARYPRDSYFIADKLPLWHVKEPGDMERIFNEQLSKADVAYFDFYLIHAIDGEKYKQGTDMGVFEFGKRLKAEGRIRHFGFSFHGDYDTFASLMEKHPEMEFVQLQLNYFDWDNQDAGKLYAKAEKHGVPVIVMEPVRGGALANLPPEIGGIFKEYNPEASLASWAIRYCASLPNVMTVLSGMSNIGQVRDNIAFMKDFKPLDDGEHAVVDKVSAALRSIPSVPCTACKYCEDCPEGIPIHQVFTLYNEYLASKDYGKFRQRYMELEEGHRAADCVACGLCVSVCPQSIPIPEEMAKIAGMMS